MSFRSSAYKFLRNERGTAAVEFLLAFVFILLFVVIGLWDMGRAIEMHAALNDGVRAAARYLTRVENPCDPGSRDAALGLLVTRTIDGSGDRLFVSWPSTPQWSDSSSGDFRFYVASCNGVDDFADTRIEDPKLTADPDPTVSHNGNGVCSAQENANGFCIDLANVIVVAQVQYDGAFITWFLQHLGLPNGIAMTAVHDEVHIGL